MPDGIDRSRPGADVSNRTTSCGPIAVGRRGACHVAGGTPHGPIVQWDRWFNVASGGAIVGYYWTSHLKTEFDICQSSEGEDYSVETHRRSRPDDSVFRPERDHKFRSRPPQLASPASSSRTPGFIPSSAQGSRSCVNGNTSRRPSARSAASGHAADRRPSRDGVRHAPAHTSRPGSRLYVSERAFIRTDVRTSWSTDGLAALGWRSGVGVDF